MRRVEGSPADAGGPRRPVPVQALSALLLVEGVTAVLIGLAGMVLVGVYLLTGRGSEWGHLVGVLGGVLVVLGPVIAAALGSAWLALRRRRGPLLASSMVGHVAPSMSLLVLGLGTDSGPGPLLPSMAALGAAGAALTLAPATRAWVGGVGRRGPRIL